MEPNTSPDDLGELKKLVLEHKCVALVGAGLSIPPGRDWETLVNDIAGRCGVPFGGSKPLPEVVDECIEKNERECNAVLKDKLPGDSAVTRAAIGYLLRLKPKSLITANFDPWIRQQAKLEDYPHFHIYPDLPLREGIDGHLFYLHGFFDSGSAGASIRSIVLGAQSFREAYEDSLLPGFLLNVFVYENVWFVGFKPTEPHIAGLLKRSTVIRQRICDQLSIVSTLPRRFALLSKPMILSPEKQAEWDASVEEIRSLDVTPVFYDPKADDHRGLDELLLGWVGEGDMRNRPPVFKTGFDRADAGSREAT